MEADSDHQSGAGALIGSNHDLLTEILIRLPATSILRFKLVSKHWRLLLSHKHFIHRSNNLSKSPGTFACTYMDAFGKYHNVYVPFDVEDRSPPPSIRIHDIVGRAADRIEQSCNGLLLCSMTSIVNQTYCVFNPTTKQMALIPSVPGKENRHKTIRCMALAFHHEHCAHYKVVCVHRLYPERSLLQIQVYSSDTGKWKICIESFSAGISQFHHPVYWNGAVHWPPNHQSGNHLCFKIDDEQLQTLPVPEGLAFYELSTMYFGESGGHLHLILRKEYGNNFTRVNVYEMLRDHSGWFVKYRLQLDALVDDFSLWICESSYRCDFRVVDVVRDKEEDVFLVVLTCGKLIRYNVHDKSFKVLHRGYNYYLRPSITTYRYIETLSSF